MSYDDLDIKSSYVPERNVYFIGVVYRISDNAIINCYKSEAETMEAYENFPVKEGLQWTMLNIGFWLCQLKDFDKAMKSWKEQPPEEFCTDDVKHHMS